MLHDYASAPISTSKPYVISAIEGISSHERIILFILISFSLMVVMLLVGEARMSVDGLKRRSGSHPMLSVFPSDEIAQAAAEYEVEPTRAGRVLIVLTCVGLVKPFTYLAMVGLCIGGYVLSLFMKDSQLGLDANSESLSQKGAVG